MALGIQKPNGIEDVVPKNSHKWQTVEKLARDTAESFGFREIRIPTFEKTELFQRSVGETTDVVQKEMFTVLAKKSSFTLRPEGTAGTIRAMLQNGMLNDALPQRVYYILSCFRHERPQAGRLWEFHQFGVEMAGSSSPYADAEVISLAKSYIDTIGLKNIELNINSIGCPTCRVKYHEALKEYFAKRKDELCETCLTRFDKNPMRILDCKSPICSEIAKDAPLITDYLCEDCDTHFKKLQEILTETGIKYSINPKIVRGLDYYTKTVFEFITTDIGAQGTICGGGRYDGLIEQMGGKPTPALGFAMGLERLILTMQNQGCEFMASKKCDLYIASMGEKAQKKAVVMASSLREEGYHIEYDVMDRSLKAQMKYADKIKSSFVMVLGDNELESDTAKLKNMKTGQATEISLGKGFSSAFATEMLSVVFDDGEGNLLEGLMK